MPLVTDQAAAFTGIGSGLADRLTEYTQVQKDLLRFFYFNFFFTTASPILFALRSLTTFLATASVPLSNLKHLSIPECPRLVSDQRASIVAYKRQSTIAPIAYNGILTSQLSSLYLFIEVRTAIFGENFST